MLFGELDDGGDARLPRSHGVDAYHKLKGALLGGFGGVITYGFGGVIAGRRLIEFSGLSRLAYPGVGLKTW